jgi:hypothetical protein
MCESKVDLDIKGVTARAMLKVRLENPYAILDRALTSLDRNPAIVNGVIETADDVVSPEGPVRDMLDRLSRFRLRRVPAATRRLQLGTLATAAMVGGAAFALHSNRGVEKTLRQTDSLTRRPSLNATRTGNAGG